MGVFDRYSRWPALMTSWSMPTAGHTHTRVACTRCFPALDRGRVRPLSGPGRAVAAQPGRHLLGLLGQARHREDLPRLPGAPRDRGAASGRDWSAASCSARARCNAFLDDIYGEQRDPARRASSRATWCSAPSSSIPKLRGIKPAGRRAHPHRGHRSRSAAPTARSGVLEDNLRTPSGVSYVLENRLITKRVFQDGDGRRPRSPRRAVPGRAGRRAALGGARATRRRRDAWWC